MSYTELTFGFRSYLSALKLNLLQSNFESVFDSDTDNGVKMSTMMDKNYTYGSGTIAAAATYTPAKGAYWIITVTGSVGYFGGLRCYDTAALSGFGYAGHTPLVITDGNELYFYNQQGVTCTYYYHKWKANSGAVTAVWTNPEWAVNETPVEADKVSQIFENFEAISEGHTASGNPPQLKNIRRGGTTGSVGLGALVEWTPAAGVYVYSGNSLNTRLWSGSAWVGSYVRGVFVGMGHCFGGLFACDGSNQRLRGPYSGSTTVYYEKLP